MIGNKTYVSLDTKSLFTKKENFCVIFVVFERNSHAFFFLYLMVDKMD